MNKRNNSTTDIDLLSVIRNMATEVKPTKTIYFVKCNIIHCMTAASIKKDCTYNLFAFEDLDAAKEYMDTAYNCIVNPNINSGNFRIILDNETDVVSTTGGNKVLYKRVTKIIGTKDTNYCQTKLFTFTIETINLK